MDAWHTEPKVVVLVAVGGWGECGGGKPLSCLHLESSLPVWSFYLFGACEARLLMHGVLGASSCLWHSHGQVGTLG